MKEIVRYGTTLGLICLLAAGLLAGVNSLAQPRILAQAKQEEEKTLAEVLPLADRFEAVKTSDKQEVIYYRGYDKDNRLAGLAFKAEAKGYSSTVETMAGMGLDGRISVIKILSQNETPGLGSRITEDSFTSQFSDKDTADLWTIEAVTGATISSRAVIDSVQEKAEEIKTQCKIIL